MVEETFLQKHLIGFSKDDDGKYCFGKYTGCTESLVEGYFAVASCNFVRICSHVKGDSKRFKTGISSRSSIFFHQTNSTVPIPYNGYPFEVIATEKWLCNETSPASRKPANSSTNRKRKMETPCCASSIQIRTARMYNEFALPKDRITPESEFKKAKDQAKDRLIEALKSAKNVSSADVHYCRFPLPSSHDHHEVTTRSNATQLDKRVTNKIRQLAKNGICDIASIKSMISDFVLNTIFAHAEEDEKPKMDNRRFFPTAKAIRNHMFLAVGKVSNMPGYDLRKNASQEDTTPPSVTNIIEIPESSECSAILKQRKIDVGFVAIHAGAGYHSDERWPGYKHLCRTVCIEVSEQLKEGLSAGEAVTLAVKLLEDSELTNAGHGSNLTETGKVECDASVMDSTKSQDPTNQCDSYFGSVACVNKVKNPVCAAYKILDERRKRCRLELGRIPPSFLVGEGAENWAKAHGVEMCGYNDLVSESAHKSWQKYHRKLLEKLARSNKTCSSQNKKLVEGRLDTVGAVALDLDGNVASAVSSGGIILKMPGRVGQAALYGCGCWAEPSRGDLPSVAVTTSGCGEQLISTMLGKKCAENLQSQDQPYQALQNTLVKDFLGSPMLNFQCDKQAGLLCLHHSVDGTQSTVEVVWGHTTSSMVVGHMSTTDKQPNVILSRLPENATPGKSVTVGGSWTRVACTENIQVNSIAQEENVSSDMAQSQICINNSHKHEDNAMNSLDGLVDCYLENGLFNDPDISIMFVSPLSNGLSKSACKAQLSKEFDRKIDSEFEVSICKRWEERKEKNPRLFNAQKFRIHSVEYKMEDGSPKLMFHLGLTCYRDYMETNWAKEVENLKEKGSKDHDNSQAYLAEPLGVAAIVITDDNQVVFQWRNSWVAEGAGQLDVPGGHPEPSGAADVDVKQFVSLQDLKPDDVIHELFESQMKEVRDEVNVPMEKIGEPVLMGLVRNKLSGGRAVAYFCMRCHMSSEEVLNCYKKGGPETDESTNLHFLPEKDIANLDSKQQELWQKMCPNGKAACTLYAILTTKAKQEVNS